MILVQDQPAISLSLMGSLDVMAVSTIIHLDIADLTSEFWLTEPSLCIQIEKAWD